MTEDDRSFCLKTRGAPGAAPVLAGVSATGRVDGVLFDLTLRQTYRNDSDRVLEVVYTFPLPPLAVLLGFAAELNGARQVGTIVAKPQAERTYERALAQGDAPVLLEAGADGLHTANIGNLKPGDQMVLEVRFAQTLQVEQGRLRLALPTTIAPRYGNPLAAGLQAQQVPVVSMQAEYPLAVSVTIAGALASADIDCPTHDCRRTDVGDGVRLDLQPGAWLDRDLVIVVQPREAWPSLVVQAVDAHDPDAPSVRMACLRVPLARPRRSIGLKVLVDCSGSMGGDSIASAKVALQAALDTMTLDDGLSISRFGSSVEHVLPAAIGRHGGRHPGERLRPVVERIEADLGGTEMHAALTEVFDIRMPRGGFDGVDVLLITDGEIWNADGLIAAARDRGHRVFAIGVGAAPAEGMLRRLAEATGGACEFATPGELLEAAAHRMLTRIRQPARSQPRIDWGTAPLWQTGLPHAVFGGDTVVAFAGLREASRDAVAPVRLCARTGGDAEAELARAEVGTPVDSPVLARVAAAHRLNTLTPPARAALATRYQLMSPDTPCILVHERAEADRASEDAKLHRVSSMLAAGWGGTGRVLYSISKARPSTFKSSRTSASKVWHEWLAASSPDAGIARCGSMPSADQDINPFFNAGPRSTPAFTPEPATLAHLARRVLKHMVYGGAVHELPGLHSPEEVHASVAVAIDDAMAVSGLDRGTVWLVLALWVMQRDRNTTAVSRLQAVLAGVGPDVQARCNEVFDRLLADADIERWPEAARTSRLRRTLKKVIEGA